MPAVLVHGVPDTPEMWAPVVARLTRDDVVCPRLPGFGSPIPAGFGCTKDEYADWLVGELVAVGEPVDLVGHDWGSLLTQRVATTRPELLRSWVLADGAVSEAFRWHELATQWQTPGVGEQIMELDDPRRGRRRAGRGRPSRPEGRGAPGRRHDEAGDPRPVPLRGRHRRRVDSAGRARGPAGAGAVGRPRPVRAPRVRAGPPRQRVGAPFVELDAGHWSVAERPVEAAAAVEEFWSSC